MSNNSEPRYDGGPGEAEPVVSGKDRLPSRFGTIVWGVIVLGFAVVVAAFALAPRLADPGLVATIGIVAGGLVLVGAGTAAALRKSE